MRPRRSTAAVQCGALLQSESLTSVPENGKAENNLKEEACRSHAGGSSRECQTGSRIERALTAERNEKSLKIRKAGEGRVGKCRVLAEEQ